MVTIETPKEFAKKMADIANILDRHEDPFGRFFDQEDTHIMADELMCNLLRELGYGEGVDIFLKMPKWYA